MANKMPKQSRGFLAFIALTLVRLRDLWRRSFAKREMFVRQGSKTKRIILETGTQMQLVIVGAALITWLAYSTSGVMMGKTSTHAMQDRLAETHNAYEDRISEMQQEYEKLNLKLILAKKAFDRMAKELEIRHDHLATLIGMQDRLGNTMRDRQKINRGIKNKTKQKSKNKTQSYLKPLRKSQTAFLTSRPAGPAYAIFPAIKDKRASQNSSSNLSYGLISTGSAKIDAIGKKLAALDQMQRAILDHVDEKIAYSTEIYKRVFHVTEAIEPDLFAERIALAQINSQSSAANNVAGNKAVGGPLLSINQTDKKSIKKAALNKIHPEAKPSFMPEAQNNNLSADVSSFSRARKQINKVHDQIKELTVLDQSIRHLPLAKPMQDYYVTSSFGPRIDPFTREWSFHSGVDIAHTFRNEVYAVLPGRVAFVGHARGYGLMIEIDHGHGIKTRYGHLEKAHVKIGQKIKFKKYIGVMGNTGRSTGHHLHYEILVDEKPYDPWKFIEAGKYVFEIAG